MKWASWVAARAALLGLAACGKKEEPAAALDRIPALAAVIRLSDAPRAPDTPLYQETHALVVDMSDFSRSQGWKSLSGVQRDVAPFTAALHAQGIQIFGDNEQAGQRLRYPGHERRTDTLRSFFTDCGKNRNACLLVHSAGHRITMPGAEVDKEIGDIVPADAPHPKRNEGGLRKRAVNMA